MASQLFQKWCHHHLLDLKHLSKNNSFLKSNNGLLIIFLTANSLDVARRIFEKIDTDGSGFIEEDEVPELLKLTYK